MPTQYRIIAAGAGWIDRSARGRLRFDGPDRLSFLQALLSNEVATLGLGRGVYATWLTPQGRMITDLRVFNRGDSVLANVPADLAPRLVERFDSVIFTEDVQVQDVTGSTAQVRVIGGDAATVLGRALGLDADGIRALPLFGQTDVPGRSIFIARTDDARLDAFDIVIPVAEKDDVVKALEQEGASPMSEPLAEALRIDAGRPRFGVDMTEETIPLEAGLLERAISTTKGCYVGQEVIIRVLHRGAGRVAKRLVTLKFAAASETSDAGVAADLPAAGMGAPLLPGTPLSVDGREIGRITSVASSPHDGRTIALGYVHRDVAEVGNRVIAATRAGEMAAEITAFAG